MILVKENDVYKRERKVEFTLEETITFKNPKPTSFYEQPEYDWYRSHVRLMRFVVTSIKKQQKELKYLKIARL